MPDAIGLRAWSCWNLTPEAFPLKEPMKWGRRKCTGSNPHSTCLPLGGGAPGEQGGGARQAVWVQAWARSTEPLSLPSSSSAWPQPRLLPSTSSASTGNLCRGVTPRAEARRGKLPLPPPPASDKLVAQPC